MSRIKLHNGNVDGPPEKSLQCVLEMTRSSAESIDRVAIAIMPPAELQRYVLRDLYKIQKNKIDFAMFFLPRFYCG